MLLSAFMLCFSVMINQPRDICLPVRIGVGCRSVCYLADVEFNEVVIGFLCSVAALLQLLLHITACHSSAFFFSFGCQLKANPIFSCIFSSSFFFSTKKAPVNKPVKAPVNKPVKAPVEVSQVMFDSFRYLFLHS